MWRWAWPHWFRKQPSPSISLTEFEVEQPPVTLRITCYFQTTPPSTAQEKEVLARLTEALGHEVRVESRQAENITFIKEGGKLHTAEELLKSWIQNKELIVAYRIVSELQTSSSTPLIMVTGPVERAERSSISK